MKNKYAHRSHISEAKFRHVVRCFAADVTAVQAAELTGVNRNTVNRVYGALRERIRKDCQGQRPVFAGSNDNRPVRQAAQVNTSDQDSAAVFGIFEQEGQVYTEIVAGSFKTALRSVIRGKIDVATVANTDEWPGYHGFVDLGLGHFRVNHAGYERHDGRLHINGIEGFWGLAKVRLSKFKGVPAQTFHLHLKETEWRYNNRASDKYKMLLGYLRDEPIN